MDEAVAVAEVGGHGHGGGRGHCRGRGGGVATAEDVAEAAMMVLTGYGALVVCCCCCRGQTVLGHGGGHVRRRDPVGKIVVVVMAKEVALATIGHVADTATMVMAEGVADAATVAPTGAGRGHGQRPGRHGTALGREHAGYLGSVAFLTTHSI